LLLELRRVAFVQRFVQGGITIVCCIDLRAPADIVCFILWQWQGNSVARWTTVP
jgi:hypothetical protein